jgi:threonine aldolase
MVDRLAEDHANARTLAEGLAEIGGISCDLSRVETNIVYFDLLRMSGREFEDECRKRDVLGGATEEHRVRFVTHDGITASDVQEVLRVCADVMGA